ncbi:MAG: protein phosphatase 2C domain-containing protein [Nanoarchaeota archaeon]|nr:protein phosphatase 2C domain-containing protein [Nanoarchaeota archaeon]MBU1269511.1 protein phosphatase 2C domain-containing protein [Nanoarchaeota archaeon]MBU1604055.1 protein phosphatase 2C domain-containing protein [Nanoarchaeota archaeon]MBU2442599.1 protein phosphatase 2C domain-containing protein [Nanoarchaeota archaeon]
MSKHQDAKHSSKGLEYLVDSSTSIGKYRTPPEYVNEDSKSSGMKDFYIIADGLGGHGNGDFASGFAVWSLEKSLLKFSRLIRGNNNIDEDYVVKEIERLIKDTNSHVHTLSKFSPILRDFKTTIATVLLHREKAYVSNVGDSRVYLHRNKELILLTKDDKNYENDEELTEDEIMIKNRKVPMTQSIGSRSVDIHSNVINLYPEDKILMVTDGVTDYVHEKELKKILRCSKFKDVCKEINRLADHPEMVLDLLSKYRKEDRGETMRYIKEQEKGDNRTMLVIYAKKGDSNA